MNQYETQAMQQLLLARGDTLGEFDGVCDCYIVNTCTVTAVSDKKSRNAIRRARKLNPNAVIGVCGCYAQTAPEEIRKLDVDVLIGTDGRAEFLDKMAAAAAEKLRWEGIRPAENGVSQSGAVSMGSRVSQMSRKEIADPCRRVERGEKVSFG